ncbi:MAG: AAA family ATPase [Desulfuromonadales bacterium]|nr:AAA family ATPase [Desulfuromonadales bacterium]
MSSSSDSAGSRACWFLGASYGGTDDQVTRFLNDGIWESGFKDKYFDVVKSINPGDRIAIKATYTRKHGLPFDNRGQTVSVMAIKAIGEVTGNIGDGRNVKVNWTKVDPPREWYFFTYQRAIWRVVPGDWATDALIDFTFNNKQQDIDRFRNAPFWKERFGDAPSGKHRFQWARFYEDIANKLLKFRDNREALVAGIHGIAGRVEGLSNLQDQFSDNTTGPLKDICPFTAMGIFNRGITDSNRKSIAKELAAFLGVVESVPESFEGIPILNNQKSWFFGYEKDRKADDIDALWRIFASAIQFSETEDPDVRSSFIYAYDDVSQRYGVGWNLTMGLYWIRPWIFPTLDSQSRLYLEGKLRIQIGQNGPKGRCSSSDYLTTLEMLETRFREEAFPVHSFPELSLAAWMYKGDTASPIKGWQELLLKCINEHCSQSGTRFFSFQDLLQYLSVFTEAFPNNNTPESTLARQLQIFRDKGIINFIDNKGNYELIHPSTICGEDENVVVDTEADEEIIAPPIETYSIDDILREGCFLERTQLEKMRERLRTKKNIILQGPPGTGKTWLAKRLAFALMGQRSESKVRPVQFHPNLSYEDFVRGFRPSGDGKLSLVDGPFMEMINSARNDTAIHVIVIEEINRGNPAQIFGEMLTLLEVDKRTPSEAIELCYRRSDNERVYIPGNLYVIGTMNIADRSLALVDLALRRRFAFIDLDPKFGQIWLDWVNKQCGIDLEVLKEIEKRMLSLNEEITADTSLGPQFRIGHSYVTPPFENPIEDGREWFKQVVETEIGPLLAEYWFDALDKARKARQRLIDGF